MRFWNWGGGIASLARRNTPVRPQVWDLSKVLPVPGAHWILEKAAEITGIEVDTGRYGSHHCDLTGPYEDWNCPVWEMYLDGGSWLWVERTWVAIRTFEKAKEALGHPAEMASQWDLVLQQGLALAAAREEAEALEGRYSQAVADATLVTSGNPYRDATVRTVAAAQVRLQETIAAGVASLEEAAAAASSAAAAKRQADALADATIRRASNEPLETSTQVVVLAELLSREVGSLTEFTREVELSTRHLAHRELAS